jgi:hypothetical protein
MKTSRQNIFVILLAAVLFISLSCGNSQKEIRLVFQYKVGAVNVYEKTIKSLFKHYENGQLVQNSDNLRESRTREEILDLTADGDAHLRLTETMKADSSDSLCSTSSLEYISKTNGAVEKILQTDSLNPDVLEFYTNYCEQSMPVFPDTLITEGFSWKQTINLLIADSGKTTAETVYRVHSLVRENGRDCAVIEYSGNLIIPFRKIDSDSSLTIVLEHIKSNGVLYFDYRDGLIVSQRETMEFNSEGTKIKNGISSELKMTGHISNSLQLVSQ